MISLGFQTEEKPPHPHICISIKHSCRMAWRTDSCLIVQHHYTARAPQDRKFEYWFLILLYFFILVALLPRH